MKKKHEYTLDDCRCEYCLHYDEDKEACMVETCCCQKEKDAALARQRKRKKAAQKCAA